MQSQMFSDTSEDLPLFSGGTYGPQDSGAFTPAEAMQQDSIIDMRPQFGAEQLYHAVESFEMTQWPRRYEQSELSQAIASAACLSRQNRVPYYVIHNNGRYSMTGEWFVSGTVMPKFDDTYYHVEAFGPYYQANVTRYERNIP